MFYGRRDYGPDVREALRSLERSEGSRDLYEQLHHVQVLFGLVVGEWYREVGDEAQDVIGEPACADAILDRIVHIAYRLELEGQSMLKTITKMGDEPPQD